jgi:16S rRNA (adenine1518-N6/adenine1519-N6)-dimethyltransferase
MPSTDNEILEVVDADDNVIGRATRSEIHQRGLTHRAVHIFLFNSAGDIYVQRRSAIKDRFPRRLDSSAAGHVDPGESYEQSARRELKEELGIEADLEEVLRLRASEISDNEHVVLYRALSDLDPSLDPEEIQWGGFMARDTLTELMAERPDEFVPVFIHLWNEYQGVGH